MEDTNWLLFLWDVFWKLVDFAGAIYNLLFYEFNAGAISFTLWQLLGGTALTVIIVARMVKLLVPVA